MIKKKSIKKDEAKGNGHKTLFEALPEIQDIEDYLYFMALHGDGEDEEGYLNKGILKALTMSFNARLDNLDFKIDSKDQFGTPEDIEVFFNVRRGLKDTREFIDKGKTEFLSDSLVELRHLEYCLDTFENPKIPWIFTEIFYRIITITKEKIKYYQEKYDIRLKEIPGIEVKGVIRQSPEDQAQA